MWTKYTSNNRIPGERFDLAYALLSASLPKEELRAYDDQLALFAHPAYALYVHGEEPSVTAVLAAYELDDIRFVEHLAVDSSLRGQGMGGKLMDAYIAQSGTQVALEVEPFGHSPMAGRRIGFYERHGLSLNAQPYFQPPLHAGDAPLRLSLMTTGGVLDEARFNAVRMRLYRDVYRLSEGEINELFSLSGD